MKNKLYDGTLDKDAKILFENEDSIIYQVKNNDGELIVKEYNIFSGIWLMYKEANGQGYKYPPNYPLGLLEITHCYEGRFEYNDGGERFFYLSEGDISINKSKETAFVYCPTRHYHGISVIINPEIAPKCLSCFLKDVKVSPSVLLEKFCNTNNFFVMRSTSRLEHIFYELYSAPKHLIKGYFQIKILELLLFLSDLDPSLSQAEQHSCSKTQAELAKKVCQYINAHLDIRLTIEQLASIFYVSPATIKRCFSSVYGESVYAYIKNYKMKLAAHRLKTTSQSISEIAYDFGYDNSSKFSSAFRSVMGISPTKYRQKYIDTGK